MKLQNVRFLNGGYCWQFNYFTGRPSIRTRRFQAVFVEFEHPKHGRCLIDTGYGPEVFKATSRFPARLLRFLTPIPKRQPFTQPDYLASQQMDFTTIDHVFISHFHADHIGGLHLFPQARLVYRTTALDHLRELSSWQQLNQGFIPGLLPGDIGARAIPLSESGFSQRTGLLADFDTCDFWGDGSLILIDLPGHAIGHTGYMLHTNDGPILYAVDAFWDAQVFENQTGLPHLSRKAQHCYADYRRPVK